MKHGFDDDYIDGLEKDYLWKNNNLLKKTMQITEYTPKIKCISIVI